jgi:ribosomal protein S18 acetylase RimI-like enzyme
MTEDDIASLERATFAALPPERLEEHAGWLLGLDPGTVGRAHSAVPLRHVEPAPDVLPGIAARYAAAGLPPVLRLPDVPAFDAPRAALQRLGWTASKQTLVQTAPLAALPGVPAVAGVRIDGQPDDAWAAVFLGPGFDPVDGASRVAILRRSRSAAYARCEQDGRVVAVGTAGLAHGWCGIHGMRTLAGWRRRGLAQQVLQALLHHAAGQGLTWAFLQVEVENVAAQALYGRHGFTTAWSYRYWSRA